MRRAAKVDTNQRAVVDAFRAAGASVQSLAIVGQGVPDLLVGIQCHGGRRLNLLVEVKDGNRAPSEQKLTEHQTRWHTSWRGSVHVVTSAAEAITLVSETRMGVNPAPRGQCSLDDMVSDWAVAGRNALESQDYIEKRVADEIRAFALETKSKR